MKCFRFIAAEKADHAISLMQSARRFPLRLSRLGAAAAVAALAPRRVAGRADPGDPPPQPTYGSPRVHAELRRHGVRVGRKRAERLMRAEEISGSHRRRKGKTTVRVQGVRVADDLVDRNFSATAPNQLWMSDIKEIPTWDGKLYLASVIDCYSRCVVGWSMRDDMRAELVVEALEMAVARRRPPVGLIAHSDQGSQYVSLAFGQRCRQAGIAQSMGSRGDCYDNAVCESSAYVRLLGPPRQPRHRATAVLELL